MQPTMACKFWRFYKFCDISLQHAFFCALVDQFKTFHAGRLCCGQRQPWRTAASVELRPRTCAKTMSVVLVRNPVIFLVNSVKMQLNVPFVTRVGRHALNDPDALAGTLLKTVRNVSSAIERAQREPAKKNAKMKNISSMLQKTFDFFWLSVFASVHEGKSGFRDLWWGANERGIHFAAGPDWMHLMEEGLGRHILTYIDAILQKAGLYMKIRLSFVDYCHYLMCGSRSFRCS